MSQRLAHDSPTNLKLTTAAHITSAYRSFNQLVVLTCHLWSRVYQSTSLSSTTTKQHTLRSHQPLVAHYSFVRLLHNVAVGLRINLTPKYQVESRWS